MVKIFIYFLILTTVLNLNVIKVKSCGSSSKPNCSKHIYKNLKPQKNLISQLPDSRKIGHLALVATHQSMSYYLGKNMDIRTQDLSIADQLTYGVRVLEITVRLVNSKFEIYSSGIAINKTFYDVLFEIEQLLYFHPREFVILIMNYDNYYFFDLLNHIVTKLDLCLTIDKYNHVINGWRLVKNWNLHKTINKYRGKILLATNDFLFEDCIHSIRSSCLSSKDVVLSDAYTFSDTITQKWNQYFKLNLNCYFYSNFCHFYEMSVDIVEQNAFINKSYNRRDVTAFGYYDDVENRCDTPLNYKFISNDIPDCIFKLNIFNFDFVTAEIVHHVDKMNTDVRHSHYD